MHGARWLRFGSSLESALGTVGSACTRFHTLLACALECLLLLDLHTSLKLVELSRPRGLVEGMKERHEIR